MMCSWFMENQGLTFLAQGQHGPIFGHILHKPFENWCIGTVYRTAYSDRQLRGDSGAKSRCSFSGTQRCLRRFARRVGEDLPHINKASSSTKQNARLIGWVCQVMVVPRKSGPQMTSKMYSMTVEVVAVFHAAGISIWSIPVLWNCNGIT